MLKPMLARGELHSIGATTLDEYRKYIEKDAALERRFQPVDRRRADRRGHDQHPARPARALRGPPRREDQGRGAGRRRGAVEPLHHRPLPAGQGDRPGGRGRVEAADGDRLDAGRARRGRAAHHAARDRAEALRKEKDTASRRAAGQAREGARGPEGTADAAWRATGSRRRTRSRRSRRLKEAAGADPARDRAGAARRRLREGVGAAVRPRCRSIERRLTGRRGSGSPTLQSAQRMLKEEVDEEDIAEVVSKWTGIPVSRLMEGEIQKLLQMEERLHQRVVGQDEAIDGGRQRDPPRPRRPAGPQPAARQLHLPRPDRRRQDRAGARAGRVPLRRRAGDDPHRHVRVHGEAHRVAADRRAARATSATRRRASSPRPCGAGPTPSCCSTRSRRRTPRCSTSCCRCSTTDA